MSATPEEPSLADLHAYCDGLLTGPRSLKVEEALAHHPAAAARVEAWQRLNGRIRAAYATRGSARPVPKALAPWHRSARIAAAVLLALCTGIAAGWAGRGALAPVLHSAEGIAREALDSYKLHGTVEPEVLDDALATRLGAWIDHDIIVPDLARFSLQLAGAGRLRTSTGTPALVLNYADAAGDPYVLYLIQLLPPDIPALVKLREPDGSRTLYWPYEEYRCVLQARGDDSRLRAIAHAVDAQLREADEAEERQAAVGRG